MLLAVEHRIIKPSSRRRMHLASYNLNQVISLTILLFTLADQFLLIVELKILSPSITTSTDYSSDRCCPQISINPLKWLKSGCSIYLPMQAFLGKLSGDRYRFQNNSAFSVEVLLFISSIYIDKTPSTAGPLLRPYGIQRSLILLPGFQDRKAVGRQTSRSVDLASR